MEIQNYLPKIGVNIFVIYGVTTNMLQNDSDNEDFCHSVRSMTTEDVGIKQLGFIQEDFSSDSEKEDETG